MPVSRASSSSRSSSGLKRRSSENHAEPGTALKPAPAPACPPTTSIEPAAASLSAGKRVRFCSSSCESAVSGSAIRIMCSNALTPWWTYPTWASRPAVSTRSVIAPRHACQITPPVGSAVSIACADGSISPAARRCPDPAVLPVSSSQTPWMTIRRSPSRPSSRAATAP